MRTRRVLVVLAMLFVFIQLPALAKDNQSGAGFGLASGTFDADALPDSLDFTGYVLFWKLGLTDGWGLQIQYRDMGDDEDLALGEEDDYTQIGVHAVYMWRHGKRVRPHIKFGIARTDFDAKIPLFGTLTDDDTTISVGGGLEAGSERIAFFGDYDYSEPDIFGEAVQIGNLTLGIVFKY